MKLLWLQLGDPDLEHVEECPTCGFDSLLTIPVVALGDDGVTPWPPIKACGRCALGGAPRMGRGLIGAD